jgi:hypothetical protein
MSQEALTHSAYRILTLVVRNVKVVRLVKHHVLEMCWGVQLSFNAFLTLALNSGAVVRQRTIPTERPPLVGEVSANFSG